MGPGPSGALDRPELIENAVVQAILIDVVRDRHAGVRPLVSREPPAGPTPCGREACLPVSFRGRWDRHAFRDPL